MKMVYDDENKMEEFEEERKEIWILLAVIMDLTIARALSKNYSNTLRTSLHTACKG